MEGGAFAVRITLPEDQVMPIAEAWGKYCDQVIAYQHLGTRTHCHLLLLNSSVSSARLKQVANRQERGNKFWNFKTLPLTRPDWEKYITYMSKGKYEPFIFMCGRDVLYKENRIETLKSLWVEPAPKHPLRTPLERYMDFENMVREKPLEERNDEVWIKLHARKHLFAHYKMVTQAYKNDLGNYVETYKLKYFTRL